MANQVIFPFLGVNKWQLISPAAIPQYVSKWMDDYLFSQTKRSYEDGACYIRRWLPNDSIRDQFISNYGPFEIVLYDRFGEEVYRTAVETKQQDLYNPGYYIRQFELDLENFDLGYYYLSLEVPGSDPYISEPFEITSNFPYSVYVEYTHPTYKDGVWFGAPFFPALRIPAVIDYDKPGNRNTIYEDQPANTTMIKSVPYRIFELTVGDAYGIPWFEIDKLDRIMGCEFVKFDGHYLTKQEGQDWEKNELERYKKAGWKHSMREKLNKNGTTYQNDVVLKGTVVAAAVIDGKGFGIADNGGDFLEIEDIN